MPAERFSVPTAREEQAGFLADPLCQEEEEVETEIRDRRRCIRKRSEEGMERIGTRSVALIGFMGTGKTTVGKRLARRLGYRFVDSDSEIETRAGCSIRSIFLEQGEAAFRSLESETLAALAAQPEQVIATGGGAVLQTDNAALLRTHCLVVWLTASPRVILKRVGNAETRPLLAHASDPLAHIRQLLESRSQLYDAAAHLRVNTTDRKPEAIAEEIARLYRQA
jgi:shikimate kinase